MLTGFNIFIIALVILVILTVIAGVRTVPQGFACTVERFGRYSRTLGPGLGLIVPYIERIGRRMNMMEQVLDIPGQEGITRDNAGVSIDAVAFFQVLDAPRAAYEVSNLPLALLTLTMTNIRTVVGSMDLDELLSHRDEINERLLRVMDQAAAPWGVKVTRIEIKDIQPPPAIVEAMTRQMRAEREKRANVLEAEGLRQAAILRAEGEKQAQILASEGRREAAFRDAEARERQAEAEATATSLVSAAIAAGDVTAVNFLIAEKYIEAFRVLAASPNQKIVVAPYDSAGLIGAVAGIAEISKQAFAESSRSGEARRGPVTTPRV